MPNANYVKGRNKEYAITKALKKMGYDIAQRTAGSHSPLDVLAIDRDTKSILLIQAKPKSMTPEAKRKLELEYAWLNGEFNVEFSVE